jgi:hypothetical protein
MGREAEGQVQFRGQAGLARIVLESDALILRGDLRARVARGDLLAWHGRDDDLCVETTAGPLVLTLGAAEVARWCKALDKPLPTLAEKLGLAGQALWILTPVGDATLEAALVGATQAEGPGATLALAVLRDKADLDAVSAVVAQNPALPLWAVHEKGPRAGVPDSVVRAVLRAAGLVDTKACAVSPTLSGTRYQRRKA